jgi:hypothetical protein
MKLRDWRIRLAREIVPDSHMVVARPPKNPYIPVGLGGPKGVEIPNPYLNELRHKARSGKSNAEPWYLQEYSKSLRRGKLMAQALAMAEAAKAGLKVYSYDPKGSETPELDDLLVAVGEYSLEYSRLDKIKRIRKVIDTDDGRAIESKYFEIAAIAREADR